MGKVNGKRQRKERRLAPGSSRIEERLGERERRGGGKQRQKGKERR